MMRESQHAYLCWKHSRPAVESINFFFIVPSFVSELFFQPYPWKHGEEGLGHTLRCSGSAPCRAQGPLPRVGMHLEVGRTIKPGSTSFALDQLHTYPLIMYSYVALCSRITLGTLGRCSGMLGTKSELATYKSSTLPTVLLLGPS